MVLQEMTKEQLIEKVEELSVKLQNLQEIFKEVREESGRYKKDSDNYYRWWQESDKKNLRLNEALKAAAIAVSSIANNAAK